MTRKPENHTWIAGLVEQFRQGQVQAVIHVNRELLFFYWCLGRDINEMDMEHKYGKGIIHTISKDLQRKLPHIKGLTEKNIYYCKGGTRYTTTNSKNSHSLWENLTAVNFQKS